jgi:hypothetical protein
MQHLPAGYKEASKETGAMRRTGKSITNAADLMWLVLVHLSQGHTLTNMSAFSEACGLGKISDVAFMKRLINCNDWFKWILQHLASSGVADYLKPKGMRGYRFLAVDASNVSSGVSKFSKSWRLHFALDIFSMASHEFMITEQKVGETLINFKATKGDLFLGDRVHSTKKGISHCLANEADFILRLKSTSFPVFSAKGTEIDLLKWIKSVKANEAAEIPVFVDLGCYGLGMRKLRICALKKSKEDIEKAMKRIDRKCSKKQEAVSAGTRKFNEYIVMITSLPDSISAEEVLEAYRYRWQVELYFKRLKSLLETGEVPKKRSECMEAWLNGKMVLAILFEVLLSKLDFSPLEQNGEEEA